jgi:hypothetical protein
MMYPRGRMLMDLAKTSASSLDISAFGYNDMAGVEIDLLAVMRISLRRGIPSVTFFAE